MEQQNKRIEYFVVFVVIVIKKAGVCICMVVRNKQT